jgi:hypothetical protein
MDTLLLSVGKNDAVEITGKIKKPGFIIDIRYRERKFPGLRRKGTKINLHVIYGQKFF